jgi:hypothetical protein
LKWRNDLDNYQLKPAGCVATESRLKKERGVRLRRRFSFGTRIAGHEVARLAVTPALFPTIGALKTKVRPAEKLTA